MATGKEDSLKNNSPLKIVTKLLRQLKKEI